MKERAGTAFKAGAGFLFCIPIPAGGSETAFCSFEILAKYLSQILSAQQV
jgi:hypothetical protein